MKMTIFLGEYFYEKEKALGYVNHYFFEGSNFIKRTRL